ncbi:MULTISPECIES: hypothetical protein [Cysteiniphilum]|uniref:F-box domain-containing protein n=1 Tax=Cysteiniphilum litorale TaxID=2056700 RepID=A0A8J2Z2Z2_9GAMM|nr:MULTISPECIES: hypothetical protein [Cysteiniphilum]GGF91013.1 hypothetical protein GCM10010995_05390 [Cysteiniphilum litorale]
MFLFEISSKNKQSQLNLNPHDIGSSKDLLPNDNIRERVISYLYFTSDYIRMRQVSKKFKKITDDHIAILEKECEEQDKLPHYKFYYGHIFLNMEYYQHLHFDRNTWIGNSEAQFKQCFTYFHNPVDIFVQLLSKERNNYSGSNNNDVFDSMKSRQMYSLNQRNKQRIEMTIIEYIKHYYLPLGTNKGKQLVNITYAETDNKLHTQLLKSGGGYA